MIGVQDSTNGAFAPHSSRKGGEGKDSGSRKFAHLPDIGIGLVSRCLPHHLSTSNFIPHYQNNDLPRGAYNVVPPDPSNKSSVLHVAEPGAVNH
jgi:hypothetical protein